MEAVQFVTVSRRAEVILTFISVLAVAALVMLAKYRWHLI